MALTLWRSSRDLGRDRDTQSAWKPWRVCRSPSSSDAPGRQGRWSECLEKSPGWSLQSHTRTKKSKQLTSAHLIIWTANIKKKLCFCLGLGLDHTQIFQDTIFRNPLLQLFLLLFLISLLSFSLLGEHEGNHGQGFTETHIIGWRKWQTEERQSSQKFLWP